MGISVTKIDHFNGHRQSVYTLCKADENSFISAGGDGMAIYWRCKEKDGLLLAQVPAPIFTSFFDLDSHTLWLGTREGEIYSIDTKHRLLKNQVKVDTHSLFALHFDGRYLFAGGQSGRLLKLDAISLELKGFKQISVKSIRKIHQREEKFMLACSDGCLYEYDVNKNESLGLGQRSEMSVFGLESKGENLFTSGRDARIHVWNNSKELFDINAHWYAVNDLALNPRQSILASASMDKSIKFWNPETMELLKVIDKERMDGHHSSVNKLIWLDENRLVSCSDDRSVQLFEVRDSK